MSFIERVDRLQQRHRRFGLPIAVVYKYIDDQGAYLAALIAYYGFIAIFPLFLLLSSILGFVLDGNPRLRQSIMDSAVNQVPVVVQMQEIEGSGPALVVGVFGALYGAMGVAQALQNAMNVAWNVPRNRRPNPVLLRVRSLGVLALLGLSVLASTALSQVGAALASLGNEVSRWVQTVAIGGSFLISVVLFVAVSRVGIATNVGIRRLLPGAVIGAAGWQTLQWGGTRFVAAYVANSTVTYGVFAFVLGLLAWLFLAAVIMVLSIEINVVLAKKLYPRSLLTPMTDNVDLTPADQRAYTGMARAQRLKGFQRVVVAFDHEGQNATARRSAAQAGHRRRSRNGQPDASGTSTQPRR